MIKGWKRRIDVSYVWRSEVLTFEEKRDFIADIIAKHRWAVENDFVAELAAELREAEDVETFDLVWDAIYDRADDARVWIETIGRGAR